MPRLQAELRGCLRYRGCGPGPRLSFLHVRLSAAAARALSGCGQRQGAPGLVIAFQCSQGCLTLPGGPGHPPAGLRLLPLLLQLGRAVGQLRVRAAGCAPTYPSSQQEKQHCEYLHQKLSHISSLIPQFEGSGSS